jgi:hypothetical protein
MQPVNVVGGTLMSDASEAVGQLHGLSSFPQ